MRSIQLNPPRLRSYFAGVLFLTACFLWSATALAGGPQPISAPTTITTAGKYIVVQDIVGTSPVISIFADHVELDLGGFALSTAFAAPAAVIHVEGATDVTIKNGRIVRTDDFLAIRAVSCGEVRISNVRVSRGMIASRDATLRISKSEIVSSLGRAVEIVGGSGSIESSTISGFKSTVRVVADDFRMIGTRVSGHVDGVAIWGRNALILRCVIGNGDNGLSVQGDHARILNSRVSATAFGLLLYGSYATVEGNVLGGLRAIEVEGTRNRILDNTIQRGRLIFRRESFNNTYRGNIADWGESTLLPYFLLTCDGPATKNFCDEGISNLSLGGNFLPDEM